MTGPSSPRAALPAIRPTPGAGRIIEVEEHGIPLEEVPRAVRDALKAQRPHFAPTQVEVIFQSENAWPTAYGFEGKDGDVNEVEIYISADGTKLLNR